MREGKTLETNDLSNQSVVLTPDGKRKLEEEIAALEHALKREEQFGQATLPFLTRDKLTGQRLAIVQLTQTTISSEVSALKNCLEQAGAQVVSTTSLLRYNDHEQLAEVLESEGPLAGRGYGKGDLVILQLFGVCAAFASSLVLALYVQNEAESGRFATPGLLWAIVPLVPWNCRIWLATARGYMHHDPILYAVRDRVTWAIAACTAAAMLAARGGLV